MFKDKMDIKEKIAVGISGPEVQPEEIIYSFPTPIKHANGCEGCMIIYSDKQSCEVRAKCDKCGNAYTLARTEDGFFKRG